VRRAALGLLLPILVGSLASVRRARADALPVDLSWDAPAECPSQDEVMKELARIVRVREGRVVTPINAQAKIEHVAGGRYRLHLRTQREDQTGDTDLDAVTCAVLKRGVTLVLALALGDGVDLVDEKAQPPAEPPPKPPLAPVPPQPPVARRPPAEQRQQNAWRLSPWVAGVGSSGLNGKPAFGAQIGLEMGRSYWQALLQLSYLPPTASDRVQGIDSSFSAVVAAAGACARLPLHAWSVAACAVTEVGAIHGSAQGSFRDSSNTAPWYALGPAVIATAPIYGRVQLHLAVSLSVAWQPPRFAIQGLGDVYVVSRYVPAVALGMRF